LRLFTGRKKSKFHHEVSQRPAGGRTAMGENGPAGAWTWGLAARTKARHSAAVIA